MLSMSIRVGSWTMGLLLLAMPAVGRTGEKAAHPPVVAGFERFFAGKSGDAAWGGQLLLGELNCVSCHLPEGAKSTAPKTAPVLDSVGARLKHSYLRSFLNSPHTSKPGTAMPDLFASDPDKAPKIEALVHFLAATGTPRQERPDKKLASTGKDLYNKVGCVACHGSRDARGNVAKVQPDSVPLGDLRAKYTLGSLRLFLQDPHAARPAGRMPSLLNPKEAAEVANYLLQGIVPPAGAAGKNMKFFYYEGEWDKLPDFTKLKAKKTGQAEDFDVHVGRRDNNMALKFEGFLRLQRAGAYTFHVTSDDGSKLWIDDKLVVNNDGIHPPTSKGGTVELTKGTHQLVVGIFNAGGGIELAVEIEGPGLGRQTVGAFVSLTAEAAPAVAQADEKHDEDSFAIDAGKAAQGRALFASAGCINCHALKLKGLTPIPATPLAKLRPDGGCLAPQPIRGVPWFGLSAAQRSALAAVLKAPASAAPAPAEIVRHTLLTFNCYACHERDKVGGIEEALNGFFLTTQPEMGDEGRIPPSLNGVGSKLNAKYLAKVLDKGAHDRPYMHTRMPGFGAANVGHLVKLFAELDPAVPVAAATFVQPLSKVKAEARHMVGAQALGCVRCHTFAGKKAEGVQGIDMALMTERVQRAWFHRYLENPTRFRPGTRMPTSWPDGTTLLPKVLDGKAASQIEAIWAYLSDGAKARLPLGVNKQFIPLTPLGEAIVYRNFIEGAGVRAIGVGYPEKANLAFDANDLRLALVWQGAFIDAARHWTGRGEGFEPPLGDNIIHLPAGVSFATLGSLQEPWPSKSAKALDYRFAGYTLTKDQRPTFKYTLPGISVEDRPEAVAGSTVRRELKLTAAAAPENLYFRAAVGAKIEAQGDGWYRIDGEWRLKLDAAAEPQLRHVGGKTELLVPIRFKDGRARLVEEFGW
jgi:mono/diheme cytochrome c family protein